MNFQYTLQIDDNQKSLIKISEPNLLSLQDLLNTINVYPYIQDVIDEFKAIKEKSSSLDDLIENKYNGYWEDEDLGKCFTVLGFEDICAFMKDGIVLIESEYLYPEVPRVKLDITEFIQILESWRDILKSHFKK